MLQWFTGHSSSDRHGKWRASNLAQRLLSVVARVARGALLDRFEKADRGLDDDYMELLRQLQQMQLAELEQRELSKEHQGPTGESEIEAAQLDVGSEIAEPEIVEPETHEARLLYALHAERTEASKRCSRFATHFTPPAMRSTLVISRVRGHPHGGRCGRACRAMSPGEPDYKDSTLMRSMTAFSLCAKVRAIE